MIAPVPPCVIEFASASDSTAAKRRASNSIQIIYLGSDGASPPPGMTITLSIAGGASIGDFEIQSKPPDPTVVLRKKIAMFSNPSTRAQAESFLLEVRPALLDAFRETNLPPLHAAESDDGSATIEWVFGDRRLGFSFEVDPQESGWYFVSSLDSGGVLASGTSSNMDLHFLVTWAKDHGQKGRR